MNLTKDQIRQLLDQVQPEGDPRLFGNPMQSIPDNMAIPASWRDLLKDPAGHLRVSEKLWAPVAKELPAVSGLLQTRLSGIALLLTKSKPPSLLYLFLKSADLFAHRGYLPAESLPEVAVQLPVDLERFYRIHDGWVDLFSADTGPLPSREWRIIGAVPPSPAFLEVFTTGGNSLGFDLSKMPPRCHAIWSDEEVAPVKDFWAQLDTWIAGSLEEMDPASP